MSARILTVVDSYDAMTSRRVYREPLSTEHAKTELLRCSGTQYDPLVVEAFLHVLDSPDVTLVAMPIEAARADQEETANV